MTSAYDALVLSDGALAFWPLNDAAASLTAADASGNGHTATVHGGVTFAQPSLLPLDAETAALFDGTTGYLSVPYSALLNGAHFTLEVWASITGGAGGYRALISNRDLPAGAANGNILYDKDNGALSVWYGAGATGFIGTDALGAAALNTPYYIAGTFDGTTETLYINGAPVNSRTTGSVYVPNSAQELRIGAGQNESTPTFFVPGVLQKAAVYGAALSAAQVATHYSAGAGAATNNGPQYRHFPRHWFGMLL